MPPSTAPGGISPFDAGTQHGAPPVLPESPKRNSADGADGASPCQPYSGRGSKLNEK